MDWDDIPDSRKKNYPKRWGVPVSEEDFKFLQLMKAKGKNPAAFLRKIVERELIAIKKKVG